MQTTKPALTDEALKAEVRSFWNTTPCGSQFTRLERGTREFFDDVERTRYETHPFMRRAVEFDAYRGQRLLEIGMGLGTDLLQFARAGAKVTGIDLTPASVELVQRRFELEGLAVDARVADAEHLPFADGSFDAVYSFGVLHHTPDTQRAIDEIYRVLAPGGRVTVMLYHKHSLRMWLGTPLFLLRGQHDSSRPAAEEWARVYDGLENPLGKTYSRDEVRRMFGRFREPQLLCRHPTRPGLPSLLNALGQRLLAPWCGFFLIIKARK
jgi:ubiquinone/menaquinone biosynthesis C-methylase UbiE